MQRNYNYIYSKLVEQDSDLIGHIAYSLYKKSKIEYIEKKKSEGETLTDIQLMPFNDFSSSESSIDSYKIKAELIIQGFIENILEEELKNTKEQAVNQQSEILKEIIKPITPNFMSGVWQNVVAALIISAIIALFALIINFTTNGFLDTMGKLFDVEIKEKIDPNN
ncbi:hypothetical protein Flavo103_20310 [Flavobacterium collinsii]|uniref:hypothetical protein n=1 Tax=Flavobacterium collinsii TaxID=1114861 RepID=UPI0022C0924A|nr:hypothetical protein [Flavobacterium collinsii]GIQ58895.1 hypothetical protein Flavo103_20310 [Flavobacterium collinsii]